MTNRAVPTALSFGQLFLFDERASKTPDLSRLNRRRPRRRKKAALPNLKRIAVVGWALGFAGSILFQCLWGASPRHAAAVANDASPQGALVAAASRR